MARTIKSVKDFERWKSTVGGKTWIKGFDRRGDEISVCVPGGKEFNILPEERQLSQEYAAEAYLDPFQNGQLVPVKLVESASDYEDLKGNPNHLTEQDMQTYLEDPQGVEALKAAISQVKNPTTLVRLLAIAEDPTADYTVKQVAAIKDRLQEVQQQSDYEEIEALDYGVAQTSDGRDVIVTKAPLNRTPPNPSAGRRAGRN